MIFQGQEIPDEVFEYAAQNIFPHPLLAKGDFLIVDGRMWFVGDVSRSFVICHPDDLEETQRMIRLHCCWFCGGSKFPMSFSDEFDCYYHDECLQKELPEARIMAAES